MVEEPGRRCPKCHALVGEDAEWCGQCFTDLRPQTESEAVRFPVITDLPQPAGTGTNGGSAAGAAVSTEAPQLSWPCGACGRRNAMELDACMACGTPFGRAFDSEPERPRLAPRAATRWSFVYPGLGHFRAGSGLEGISHAIVFTWAFATGITFLSVRPKGGLGAIGTLGAGFLVCAVILYAVTAIDAGRYAAGERPVISTRRLLWVAAAMVLLSVVSAALITGSGISQVRG